MWLMLMDMLDFGMPKMVGIHENNEYIDKNYHAELIKIGLKQDIVSILFAF